MPAPSPLAIATSAFVRLLKEQKSYHDEITSQEKRIQKLEQTETEDENAEYMLAQEKTALQQSKDVLPPLKEKIDAARTKLESLLTEEKSKGNSANKEEITKAEAAIAPPTGTQ